MLWVPLPDHAVGPIRAPILVWDAEPLLLYIDWVIADPTRYSVWPGTTRGPQVRKRQDLCKHKGSNSVSETSLGCSLAVYRREWWRCRTMPHWYSYWKARCSWQAFPASLIADYRRCFKSQRDSKYKRNVCIVIIGVNYVSIIRARSLIIGFWQSRRRREEARGRNWREN